MPRSLFLAAAFLFSLLTPSHGQLDFAQDMEVKKNSTVASFHSEVKSIAPGKPFTVALQLAHPAEWHSYYKNTGGVANPPKINWTLPDGFTAGEIQWPTPEIKDVFGSNGFVYDGTPIFLVEITPPANLKTGEAVKILAKAGWQICDKSSCNDEKAEFSLSLNVADAPQIDPSKADLFTKARAALPKLSAAWKLAVESAPDSVKIRMTPGEGAAKDPENSGLEFIPADNFVLTTADGGSITKEGSDLIITVKRAKEAPNGDPTIPGKSLSGILVAKSPLDTTLGAKAILLSNVSFSKPPAASLSFGALLPVLGGMLLGGLILNLMPCVFPVLGLKIMSFVQQAGQERRKIIFHGLAFTGGVLISFWIISGILYFLREHSGAEIGWGYQLQNKWFVYGLVMLFFVFGLNMFGLFEVGTSATSLGGSLQSRNGISGSFFSGVLATVAATPCSAPILGPAIGAAVVLPTVQFFTAFTAMALGLSLPYLLLSMFPKLIDFLPRPGAWMESFKQGMAFLLLGAAGYFFWVYMDHVVPDVLFIVILGFVAIALACWIYGRWSTPMKSTRVRWMSRLIAVIIGGAGLYSATGPYHGLEWERWSQGKVDTYLEQGTPVYVDFTAKWCATCQVNKKRAYSDEVIALFKERGIVPLKADKTKPDPEIDAKVAEFNRAAIPVNVLYVPGKPPILTPELLSPEYLKELITREVPAKK